MLNKSDVFVCAGAVRESMREPESGRFMTLMDLCVPQRKTDQFCINCEVCVTCNRVRCSVSFVTGEMFCIIS